MWVEKYYYNQNNWWGSNRWLQTGRLRNHFYKHQKENEKHSCTLCVGDHPPFLCPRAVANSGIARTNWARRETKMAINQNIELRIFDGILKAIFHHHLHQQNNLQFQWRHHNRREKFVHQRTGAGFWKIPPSNQIMLELFVSCYHAMYRRTIPGNLGTMGDNTTNPNHSLPWSHSQLSNPKWDDFHNYFHVRFVLRQSPLHWTRQVCGGGRGGHLLVRVPSPTFVNE